MTEPLSQKFEVRFYRAAMYENEIGPVLETLDFEARNKTKALKIAKDIAKANNYRFLSITLPDGREVSK